MISKQTFNALIKSKAFEAAKRWEVRSEVRKQPGNIKAISEVEKTVAIKNINNNFSREATRSAVRADLKQPIIFPERILKGNDFKEFAPNELARIAGKPVARIENIPAQGIQPEGFATGFIVSPNLLMTNYHVFPDENSAQDCAANFLYERTSAGINSGHKFCLDPKKFFISDPDFDFAIVYIEPVSMDNRFTLNSFGFLRLIETPGKILVGQPINIIQHPSGGVKRYAYQNNTVLDILHLEQFIHYTTDTERGSSGSPCYNNAWELAALHHSGVPMIVNGIIMNNRGQPWDSENQSDDEIQWIANEGISISALVNKIKSIKLNNKSKQEFLDALINTTADPLISPKAPSNSLTYPSNKESVKPNTQKAMSTINMNFSGPVTININESGTRITNEKGIDITTPILSVAGMTTEKKQVFDTDYDNRPGYDENFIGNIILKLPEVIASRESEMFLSFNDNKPYVLKYHHYSLAMNKKRKLAMWTASNVDYNEEMKGDLNREDFGGEDWREDPRIPAKYQLTDTQFYKPAKLIDRGHLVRREDNCWGHDAEEIAFANADTYHWTNCTQQHQSFNRDAFGEHGLWGMLEKKIEQELQSADGRASIFAGPILNNVDDPFANIDGKNIQYPLKFWKIIAAIDADEGLLAYGFILDQSDVINEQGIGVERLDFGQFKAQQATLHAITSLSGVSFDEKLYNADVLGDTDLGTEGIKTLKSVNDIVLRKSKRNSKK